MLNKEVNKMTNLMETFEKKEIEKLTSKKRIPAFRSGDTLKVTIKIKEGDKSRSQVFEGMCIARKNNSLNSNFTVRKISHGEGVERVFPLFSPIIEKIEVVRKGNVRRAKLYYLRNRTGKRARIADKDRGDEANQFDFIEETLNEENLEKEKLDEGQEKKVEVQLNKEEEIVEEKIQTPESSTKEAEEKSDEQQR